METLISIISHITLHGYSSQAPYVSIYIAILYQKYQYESSNKYPSIDIYHREIISIEPERWSCVSYLKVNFVLCYWSF